MAPKEISSSNSSEQEIAEFVKKAGDLASYRKTTDADIVSCAGRLVFALDATASRQPSWDQASVLQAEMFDAVSQIGGLAVKLMFFRGLGECKAGPWCLDASSLRNLMEKVTCRAGHTQFYRIFDHVDREAYHKKINTLVCVGDCLEEKIDDLALLAGKLSIHGIKVFMFQEGFDRDAEIGFREIARITGGAYARFDRNAAQTLRNLLAAVARFSVGGYDALLRYEGKGAVPDEVKLLSAQLRIEP